MSGAARSLNNMILRCATVIRVCVARLHRKTMEMWMKKTLNVKIHSFIHEFLIHVTATDSNMDIGNKRTQSRALDVYCVTSSIGVGAVCRHEVCVTPAVLSLLFSVYNASGGPAAGALLQEQNAGRVLERTDQGACEGVGHGAGVRVHPSFY